ncbi:uncharacterized protein LOC129582712 [Paramacrobiotus metropolitanus]|uniref:uncharacterized protein LOC129582712 n=1 Tax=Paramacrobiotus metropolitanus TaxID=2943436 RepID=UPI0024456B5B|nr:uncharacterized protein LOC129582712 [Paramacrobiotus metropolitanus]
MMPSNRRNTVMQPSTSHCPLTKTPIEILIVDEELDYSDPGDLLNASSTNASDRTSSTASSSINASLQSTPESVEIDGGNKENRGEKLVQSMLQHDRFHEELDYGVDEEDEAIAVDEEEMAAEDGAVEEVGADGMEMAETTLNLTGDDLDRFVEDVVNGLAEGSCVNEDIEQAFNFTDSGIGSSLSVTSGSPTATTKSTTASNASTATRINDAIPRLPAPQSPEIFPPGYNTTPPACAHADITKKLCYLAYHELPGYPLLQTSYTFLKRRYPPVRHQFLHVCHYETEKELMQRLCHFLTDTFDYDKVVIIAKRSERAEDIRNALKHLCDLDSLLITDESPKERNTKIFDHFQRGTRRILVCPASTHPPSRCLSGVNLVVYWNSPWTGIHFEWMLDRLPAKALILMVLKQQHDWKYLQLCKERYGIVFPELDVDSRNEDYAGFINARFRKEI